MSNPIADQVYNLIIGGFGYINRVREVAPKGAQSYLCADVTLLEGVAKAGDHSPVNKTRLSCIIKGAEAKEIFRKHFTGPDGQVVAPKVPVVAAMQLGGLVPSTFTYKNGERAGETGICLRASLLKITWLKIGDMVIDLEGQEVPVAPELHSCNDRAPEAEAVPATESDIPAYVRELHAEYGEQGFVKLDPEHPEFQERKTFLKTHGFRWNGAEKHWATA